MGKSVNRVTLLGNVGQPPETKTSASGALRTMASIATNERVKKADGNYEDRTEWHALIFFGRLAEIARDFMHKGSKIYVEGHLRTISWEDDTQQKRWKTSIIADNLVLLDGKDNRSDSVPAEKYGGDF